MFERFENELDRLLADQLDGELTPEGATRLAALLADDDAARAEAEALRRVDRLVRDTQRPVPDANFASMRAAIMADVRAAAEEQRGWRRRVFRITAAVVPLAAAAVLVFTLLPNRVTSRDGLTGHNGNVSVEVAARPAALGAGESKVVVAFARPNARHTAIDGATHVQFRRSSSIEQAVAARDEANRAAPRVAIATTSGGGFDMAELITMPPPI